MNKPGKILLQTTIPFTPDDWHIGRFSLLGECLAGLKGDRGEPLFAVTARDRDPNRRRIDDPYTNHILWPNFHSGANGDYQVITPIDPPHPVLLDPDSPGGVLRYLPAHPHEGDVSRPPNEPTARVIATGRSKVTGIAFNIAVAFEPSAAGGPAIAQSTFHHFCDYNWDPGMGAPSFVGEAPCNAILKSPEAQHSVKRYVRNLAVWLAGKKTIRAETEKDHLDRALDEALEESFPASDPPAILRSGTRSIMVGGQRHRL